LNTSYCAWLVGIVVAKTDWHVASRYAQSRLRDWVTDIYHTGSIYCRAWLHEPFLFSLSRQERRHRYNLGRMYIHTYKGSRRVAPFEPYPVDPWRHSNALHVLLSPTWFAARGFDCPVQYNATAIKLRPWSKDGGISCRVERRVTLSCKGFIPKTLDSTYRQRMRRAWFSSC